MEALCPAMTVSRSTCAVAAGCKVDVKRETSVTVRGTERRIEAAEDVDCHQAQDDDQRG